MRSGLDHLLESYCRAPVLPHAQQLHLARQVRQWIDWPGGAEHAPAAVKRRGVRAKQRLVETNARLVISIAKKWRRLIPDEDGFQDLIQIGVLGLAHAIEKFDPARGYALSTYITPWVEQSLRRHGYRYREPIYIPQGAADRFKALCQLLYEYERDHHRRPPIAWLKAELGLTTAQVEASCAVGQVINTHSLDNRCMGGDADSSTLLDLIASGESPDDGLPDDLSQQRASLVRALVAELSEREQQAISTLLAGGGSLKAAAEQHGVSRSRIGQVRQTAIAKLQHRAEQDPHWQHLKAA
jgi:RNA polymerase sigma factor (sigma-70 family)